MTRRETTTFKTERVVADMLLLTIQAVIAGIAISVAMAVPVVLLASVS